MVDISRPLKPLQEIGRATPQRKTALFYYDGDTVETDFALPVGWDVYKVYEAGLLQTPGAGEDYDVTNDGFKNTVVFAVAPAAVKIIIEGVMQ